MEYEHRLSSDNRNSNKRPYYDPDNDKTFLPPALSSYSIGLFNDKSKSPHTINNNHPVSGIYVDDFPDNNRLKQKLSQHFKNNDSTNDQELPNLSHVSSGTPNTSRNNSHIASHLSLNTSLHNSEEDLEAVRSTSLLTDTSKSSSIHTLKRRSIRRLGKVLGPPQRARKFELPEENLENKSSMDLDEKKDTGASFLDEKENIDNPAVFTPKRNTEDPPFAPINVDVSKDILSKENELELRRRVEQKIFKNQQDFDKQIPDIKRVPLQQISSSKLNSEDHFRKPKAPKVISNSPQEPRNHHQPEPPKPRYPISDETRRKIITINGNEYEKLELLGRGGSSKVFKVKSIEHSRLFAIKKVLFDQFDDSCVKGFKGEIDLLLRLKHSDRVVRLIDHAIGEGSIYLIMECGELDLAHVFQNRMNVSKSLDLQFVKYHAVEMLKCVQAVHEADIVHSDLKPANFLFVKGMLKIIDFGIANAVPDHTVNIYRESQIGTPNYMAPEALIENNQPFTGGVDKNTWKVGKPSDVWSCGCILYQMIYGKPPYGGYSGNQRIMAIMDPKVKIHYPDTGLGGVRIPDSAIELMRNCLARNPHERWTIDQCLNSDFLVPKVVSESFVRDLVHQSVNFGYQNRVNGPIAVEVYDQLVAAVISQIETLNYG